MKADLLSFVLTNAVLQFGIAMGSAQSPAPAAQPSVVPVHISNSFHFQVNAPLAVAAPLFGPDGERSWAGKHWNPQFLYPLPNSGVGPDVQGAVFTLQRGQHTMVWVNTIFDLAAGRMQYVAFVPGLMVSIIDVRLTATTPSATHVEVTYTRTALDPQYNDEVEAHGADDRENAHEWQQAIEAALKAAKNQ